MNFNGNVRQHARSPALAAIVMLMISACATVTPEYDETAAKADLTALQDTWVAAEIAGDAETLRSLMDERFLSTSSSGETTGRDGYIDWITSFDVSPFTAELDQIELHGDTAILISHIGEHTKLTWVAMRKNGRWVGIEQTFLRMKVPEE